jgi:N4-gp56 family major capsid protein
MADTTVITALQKQVWSKDLYKAALLENWFSQSGLMGKGANNIVELKTDLSKSEGESAIFGLIYNLQGRGIDGDNMLEGNEEAIQTASFKVYVDQKRQAIRSTGRLDEQKAAFDMRKQFKDSLAGWMQEMITKQLFLKLGGVKNIALKDVAGNLYSQDASWSNEPHTVPTADLLLGKGIRYTTATGGALSTLTVSDGITPALISALKVKAELAYPKILPLDVDGGKFYVLLVHPYQFAQLKSYAQVQDGFRYAQNRGADNPIFKGGDTFHWDGVIVKSHPCVPYLKPSDVTNKNFEDVAGAAAQAAVPVARAVFCGRQAAVFAQCKNSEGWVEKEFDYQNKHGVATGLLGGIAKTYFDDIDFGVISVDAAAVEPAI